MLVALLSQATVFAQDVEYKITGLVPDSIKQVLFVCNGDARNAVRKDVNADGTFEFTGSKPANTAFIVYYRTKKQLGKAQMLNDGTPMHIDFKTGKLEASEQNKKLHDFYSPHRQRWCGSYLWTAQCRGQRVARVRKRHHRHRHEP